MAVTIEIQMIPSEKRGEFHKISLTIITEDSDTYSINTIFHFEDLWLFARDNQSEAYDFLILSTLIYNIDRLVDREKFSNEGWTRDIKVANIPVINLDKFERCKEIITSTINFLTGDNWDLNFIYSVPQPYNKKRKSVFYDHKQNFNNVCLFSGGLDSLIGFIDLMDDDPNNNVLLISHKGLGKECTDQTEIMNEIRKMNYYEGRYKHIQSKTDVGKKWEGRRKTPLESTFRSRSLLFIAMGIYIANSISQTTPLVIPENGTISLNLPLNSSRRSACSTRTTHPSFIHSVQNIISTLGMENRIITPYNFMTKGEMIENCKGKDLLDSIIGLSCSCAKRGHNKHWDATSQNIKNKKIRHCGMCLPCLYRRVSLFYWYQSEDVSIYGTDVFHGINYRIKDTEQNSSRDFRALLDFIKLNKSKSEIEKELIVCGIRDIENIHRYSDLIIRNVEQIKTWIEHNGDDDIRKMAGLI